VHGRPTYPLMTIDLLRHARKHWHRDICDGMTLYDIIVRPPFQTVGMVRVGGLSGPRNSKW
jgi:hypothetical protein